MVVPSLRISTGSRFLLAATVLALMKLHHGRVAWAKGSADRTEDHVRESVKGSLVHLIERTIHQTSEVAFNEEILPDEKSHQISDGTELTEGHK